MFSSWIIWIILTLHVVRQREEDLLNQAVSAGRMSIRVKQNINYDIMKIIQNIIYNILSFDIPSSFLTEGSPLGINHCI